MENSVSKNKFQAEPTSREYERSKNKTYEWVPKYQIIAACILMFQLMYYASITEGWKGYLSNFVAIIIPSCSVIIETCYAKICMYWGTSNLYVNLLISF